jgi:hypothetical protein
VHLFTIMNRPGEIAGRDLRINETMKDGRAIQRHILEHFFHAYDPFAICIEAQRRPHTRIGAVSTHDIFRLNQT